MTEPVPATVDPDIDGVDAWLDANWDPQLTVRDWWARLARAGLAHSMLPAPHGRGWSRSQANELARAPTTSSA